LLEINEKFKILKNGISVIDLGAAPGSWSQYIARTVKSGRLVSIDIKGMEEIDNTIQIKGDFTKENSQEKIKNFFNSKVDVIVSDMAVNTTGIKDIDAIYTGELAMEAMQFSEKMLVKEGRFVSKIFLGSSFNEIVALGKKIFKEVKVFKPKASRKESKESFIICKILR
jgi:23S rRNA (uridine2552-2'-O)-methyltransferase